MLPETTLISFILLFALTKTLKPDRFCCQTPRYTVCQLSTPRKSLLRRRGTRVPMCSSKQPVYRHPAPLSRHPKQCFFAFGIKLERVHLRTNSSLLKKVSLQQVTSQF